MCYYRLTQSNGVDHIFLSTLIPHYAWDMAGELFLYNNIRKMLGVCWVIGLYFDGDSISHGVEVGSTSK